MPDSREHEDLVRHYLEEIELGRPPSKHVLHAVTNVLTDMSGDLAVDPTDLLRRFKASHDALEKESLRLVAEGLRLQHLAALEDSQQESRPPRFAEALLQLLAPRQYRREIAGDLEEAYRTEILPRHGLAFAQWWYWWQVLRTVLPAPWRALRRLGLVAAGIDYVRRLIGG